MVICEDKLYTKLVWVAVVLSIPEVMRRPEHRIKQIQFPHLFYFINLSRGNKGNLINKHMAILTFLLIVGLAYAAYKTCPKNEDGSIKKENVIALIVVPILLFVFYLLTD